jgi:hypothetical protein
MEQRATSNKQHKSRKKTYQVKATIVFAPLEIKYV